MSTQLLTIDEVCDRLRIARSTAYLLITNGDIPSLRIGHSRRVRDDAVADYERKREDAERSTG